MSKRFYIIATLLFLLAIAIPVERRYDKLFRHYSLTLIPEGLEVSKKYEKKIYFYPSDLITIFVFAIGLVGYRIPPRKLFQSPFWVIFLCAWASIAASPFAHYPIPYFRLLQLFTPLALFSFIAHAFSAEEKTKITRYILIAIVTAGLFQSGIAIAQYFHQAPLGLSLIGETEEKATFNIENGSRWLIDQLLQRHASTNVVMRASGTFPHANVFGGFMVFSLIATYALLLLSKKKHRLLSLSLAFQFFAMSLSYSRSALFGWLLATLVWFGFMIYTHGIKHRKLQSLAIFLLISCSLTATLLYNQYSNRGGVVNYNTLAQSSDQIRKIHQRTALEIIKDQPFLGLGFTQYSERTNEYYSPDLQSYVRSTAPHNIFLFLACETGIFATGALLLGLLLLFISFLRVPYTVETITFAALLIGFLFIGCCDFYPILFQQGKLMFFLIAALLAAHLPKDIYTIRNKYLPI